MERPFIIEPFLGVNRRDGGRLQADNEFQTLQNWYPKTKGLIYKRPGTTEHVSGGDLYGASLATAIQRILMPGRANTTLVHCRPDTGILIPQPTSDATLTIHNNTGGNIFGGLTPGGPQKRVYVCYTWVGMGGESKCNTVARVGFVAGQAVSATGHQYIDLPLGTEILKVTLPAFPDGVSSANVFIAPTDSTGWDMTYAGTISQSGGYLLVDHAIGAPAAAADPFSSVTIQGFTGTNGRLKSNTTYYVALGWVCDSEFYDGAPVVANKIAKAKPNIVLSASQAIRLGETQNEVYITGFAPASSVNGATAAYVFLGTKPGDLAPMQCVGLMKSSTEACVISDFIYGSNAQSSPVNVLAGSAVTVQFANRAVLNEIITLTGGIPIYDFATLTPMPHRHGFFKMKTDDDDSVGHQQFRKFNIGMSAILYTYQTKRGVYEVAPSRTQKDLFQLTINPPHGAPDTEGAFAQLGFVHTDNSSFAAATKKYIEPTIITFEGMHYVFNGVQIPLVTDGIILGGIIEFYDTVLPRDLSRAVLFKDSLVATSEVFPNQIFACNAYDPLNWVVGGSGTALRFMTIGDPYGAGVKGLGVFSFSTSDTGPTTQLLVTKKRGLWRTALFSDPVSGVGAPLEQLSSLAGCVAHRTIINTSIGTMFLGSDGTVYLITSAGEPYPIGGKVQSSLIHLADSDLLGELPTACEHKGFFKLFYPVDKDATVNNAQWWADIRTQDRSPITWSGPHIGVSCGDQQYSKDNDQRISCLSEDLGVARLDDESTYTDLGLAIESVAETKTYDFQASLNNKRVTGSFIELFFDSQYTHNLKVEGFADDNYSVNQSILSAGSSTWDGSSWDSGTYGGNRYSGQQFWFDDSRLLGRTYRQKITHDDDAEMLVKMIGITMHPERRKAR
jgi:hypothetical protein